MIRDYHDKRCYREPFPWRELCNGLAIVALVLLGIAAAA